MLITLLIPCHDEIESLPALEAALHSVHRLLLPEHFPELLFVDDGSNDGTVEALHDLCDRMMLPTRVLGLRPNRGIGAALREGAKLISTEVVVTYDADLPYPLEDLPKMIDSIERGADVVTASPWHPGGGADGVSAHRLALSKLVSRLYRLRLGKRGRGLHTFSCGFRAYRSEVFQKALPRRDGFVATAELLLNALRNGAKVVEQPSRLRPRESGRSKMKILRCALAHLGLMLRG